MKLSTLALGLLVAFTGTLCMWLVLGHFGLDLEAARQIQALSDSGSASLSALTDILHR